MLAPIDFPPNPVAGQTYTTPSGAKYIFDGFGWVVTYDYVTPAEAPTIKVTPHLTSSPAPPVSPVVNDLWYSTVSGFLFLWYNDGNTVQWVVANPGKGREIGPMGLPGPAGPRGLPGPPGPVSTDVEQHPYVRVEAFGGGQGIDDSEAFVLAAADGRVIALSANTVYRVRNVTIPATSPCPGIVSLGGQARIVPPDAYNPDDVCFTVLKPNNFSFDGLFFDLPTNTDPNGVANFSRAIWFSPTGRGTNYRVENCRFSGAGSAIVAGGDTFEDSQIENNYITGTFGDGISIGTAVINSVIVDNVLEDGGFATGGSQPAGAIRTGYSAQVTDSRNVNISRNTITRYSIPSMQSAIDCFSAAARGIRITDNILSYNGAGIELKSLPWVPPDPPLPLTSTDYEHLVVANNTIRLFSDRSTGAISVFHAEPGSPKGKMANVQIFGNMISSTGDVNPIGAFSHVAIFVSGYDNVLIDSNFIYNGDQGVRVDGTGPVGDTAENIVITNNTIDTAGAAVLRGGGTLNKVYIRNNPMLRSSVQQLGPTVGMNADACDELEISGNFIEAYATYALEVRGATHVRITDNTIKAIDHTILSQGAPVNGVMVRDNELISTNGPAISFGTGSNITVRGNDIDVPNASRTVVGVGFTAADNVRGMAAANPTLTVGGSLGDIFLDSTGATAGWRCTVAGTTATYVVI